MKKQTTRIVAYGSFLFLLLAMMPAIAVVNSDEPDQCDYCSDRSERIKRWKKGEDEETTINRLEARIRSFPERSTTRRKGENLVKKIRDLQEKQKNIPGESYRAIVELKSLLEDA
jgi:hypothetical protein